VPEVTSFLLRFKTPRQKNRNNGQPIEPAGPRNIRLYTAATDLAVAVVCMMLFVQRIIGITGTLGAGKGAVARVSRLVAIMSGLLTLDRIIMDLRIYGSSLRTGRGGR
jgi:hypothetical protein